MEINQISDMKIIDENGKMSPDFLNYFSTLVQQLIKNLNTTFNIPNLSNQQIQSLQNIPNGAIVYDSTNHVLKVNENGIFKTISAV